MSHQMLVNTFSQQTAPAVAVIDGEEIPVIVPELEVELVDPTGKHGSLMLHFRTSAEREAAAAKYVEAGTLVDMDF